MIVAAIIFAMIALLLIKNCGRLCHHVKDRWNFVKEVNRIPGLGIFAMICELLKTTLDSKEFTYQLEALFRKYAYKHDHGMIRVWLGWTPFVIMTRSKSAKVILESTKLVDKPKEYDVFKRLVGDGMLSSSGQTWFKARRMLTPAFHFNILQKYAEVFNEKTKILLELLDRHCDTNETFDVLPYLRRYGLDTIAETAMGVPINAQISPNDEEYYHALRKALNLMWSKIRYPWFWFAPIRWIYGFDKKLDYYCNKCKQLSLKIIATKKREWELYDRRPSMEELSSSGRRKLAFMDLLFSLRDEYNLTDDDIADQVNMFMAAGSDAVTAQIGFNLFALGHRQHLQDKVYVELKNVLGETEGDISTEDLPRLKYLYQVICETGRYTPNVVIFGRQITEDIDVCGFTIPKGSVCAISPFAIMRDPQHYVNPEKYDPEHFNPEAVRTRDPFGFIPFSAGIRNCIGNRFATIELQITIAAILRKYRVISMLSEAENRPIPEFSLKPSHGFPIRLEKR